MALLNPYGRRVLAVMFAVVVVCGGAFLTFAMIMVHKDADDANAAANVAAAMPADGLLTDAQVVGPTATNANPIAPGASAPPTAAQAATNEGAGYVADPWANVSSNSSAP
jgi:hypothetical protein